MVTLDDLKRNGFHAPAEIPASWAAARDQWRASVRRFA